MKITGANSSLPPVVVPVQVPCPVQVSVSEVPVSSDASCSSVPSMCTSGSSSLSASIVTPKDELIPDPVSSFSKVQVSGQKLPNSSKRNECLEDIQRLTDEELEFDEFLMDAAEWL